MLARRLSDMAILNIYSAGLPHGASNKLTSAVRASIVRLQSTLGAKRTFMGANVGWPDRLQGRGTLLTARFHFERHNQDRKGALLPSVLSNLRRTGGCATDHENYKQNRVPTQLKGQDAPGTELCGVRHRQRALHRWRIQRR
jgi:hypothetical protein